MRTGRPNTPGERKDGPQGEGRVRAAAAIIVNPSAANGKKTSHRTALLQDGTRSCTNRDKEDIRRNL